MRYALAPIFFMTSYMLLISEGPWWVTGLGVLLLGMGVCIVAPVPWFDVVAGWRSGFNAASATEAARYEERISCPRRWRHPPL